MALPVTPAQLPRHVAFNLTPEARAALAPLEWTTLSDEHPLLYSKNGVGGWQIGAPRQGEDPKHPECVTLSYQAPMKPGDTHETISDRMGKLTTNDAAWFTEFASSHCQDIGRVIDQATAREVVDMMRRFEPLSQSLEAILAQGGFECTQKGVYSRRDDKRGHYTLFVKPTSVWLTHSKYGSHFWTTLLSLSTATVAQSGGWIPRVWSPEIAQPRKAMARVAVHISQIWKPTYRTRRAQVEGMSMDDKRGPKLR